MARNARIPVPADGEPVRLDSTVSHDLDRGYGKSLLLFNSGSVTVELGGSDVTSETSFRGLLAGTILGIDLNQDEALYGFVSGNTDGEIDVLEVK